MAGEVQTVLHLPVPDEGRALPAIEDQRDAAEAAIIDNFRRWYPMQTASLRRGLRDVIRDVERRQTEHQHPAEQVLDFLNRKRAEAWPAKRGFKLTEANLKPIRARLAEGESVADMRAVIVQKLRQTQRQRADGTPDFHPDWLNPQTLFRPSNYAKYVAALGRG